MAPPDRRASAERPLQGTVLCFTSVAPELRTQYAELAIQMGAEHKLDLTSDTTHLIVGSTDTMKYKYVARERQDIKVLRPEWIEAVRESWMNDRLIDLEEVSRQYRMPTLANLKICITGFEDLSFRAQLQKNVLENGGEYTGDLTKDVTHLIAAVPEGKKYEYGTQWQKKIVSLKWYQDTLERGMQLDESRYHPTTPPNEQGVGAWIRKPGNAILASKRPREEPSVPMPSRKLRRTASAKFGSQNQSMWTDIVGGSAFDETSVQPSEVKNAVSMAALTRDASGISGVARVNKASTEGSRPIRNGFLSGHAFSIYGFDEKKRAHLQNILLQNGGVVLEDTWPLQMDGAAEALILAPYDVGKDVKHATKLSTLSSPIVSELWLERCMFEKSFVDPRQYALGRVLVSPTVLDISDLTFNATGFDGIETMHISKLVRLMGATYVEVFTTKVSILLCKGANINKEKLQLARHYGIPVVKPDWLYSTIQNQRKSSVRDYLFQPASRSISTDKAPVKDRTMQEQMLTTYVEVSTIPVKPKVGNANQEQGKDMQTSHDRAREFIISKRNHENHASKVYVRRDSNEDSTMRDRSDDSFQSTRSDLHQKSSSARSTTAEIAVHSPLQEVSSNSPGKKAQARDFKPSPQATEMDSHNGQNSTLRLGQDGDEAVGGHKKARPGGKIQSDNTKSSTSSVHAINGAIRELLEEQTRKGHVTARTSETQVKKSRLIGRALSNLSNSSATSNVRHSRASSVDSMNTDGMGSEIVSLQSGKVNNNDTAPTTEKATFGFMGRAKSTLSGYKQHAYEPEDADLGHVQYDMAEDAPRMTQLGYEDPEEAVALRERLAESRRKRSRLGQREDDPKPVVQAKPKRKIQDDDALLGNTGWGTGRRTRNNLKSPPGQELKF